MLPNAITVSRVEGWPSPNAFSLPSSARSKSSCAGSHDSIVAYRLAEGGADQEGGEKGIDQRLCEQSIDQEGVWCGHRLGQEVV